MIDYPDDRSIAGEAERQDIPEPVLVRDLVRIVEVLNLKSQNFFSSRSVLAGSMALRCFDSPRFTVYDADFSTSSDTVNPATAMKAKLAYSDDELEITPADLVPHDEGGTAWKSAPVEFTPIFSSLIPDPDDRSFKADVSFRGMLLDGLEVPLKVPYDLGIWTDDPLVYIMDPHETVAEKILGWCVHRQVKHYADLAYIALVSRPGEDQLIDLSYPRARDVLDGKLAAMKQLQPSVYAPFTGIDALIDDLAKKPQFSSMQWTKIMYLRNRRDRFTQNHLIAMVTGILVPGLRGH
ncbi:MAG: nucleotidyl transferase AbiEii/AbiGii toxin family protein [Solirubrobacterales bacterium]|nr:nucleotidyl transferase AbiEii/AbiGii toxin family protein [Solirubrobacterales bacterium]